MPSRLKSLELVGFKTFASKTNFEFTGNITAVVGPNGSGKSNIADALRWVLGEQAFSMMRGRKTDDMIFSGSEARPRAGMASATVTFDNSDGWLPIDFSEVSITRRAYRDGQNDYLINGQKVRLRDVTELLSKSGLAERTYTIIGQGLVDTALSLKAEERRALFEEAAGINLYRKRRELSLRRLDTTKRNLERVQDILAELTPRLRSLERQARRAQEYEQVRADLRELLRDWYGYHFHRSQKDYLEALEQASLQQQNLESARQKQDKMDAGLTTVRDQINGLRARLASWHRQLAQLHTQRETTSRELAVSDERQRSLQERQSRLATEITQREQETALARNRLQDAGSRVARLEAEAIDLQDQVNQARQALVERQEQRRAASDALDQARKQIEQLNNRKIETSTLRGELENRLTRQGANTEEVDAALDAAAGEMEQAEIRTNDAQQAHLQAQAVLERAQAQLAEQEERLEYLAEQRKHYQSETARLNAELARTNAQLDVLIQAEKSLAGYASGAKVLLEAARDGKLAGTRGALSNQLSVPPELEAAVAAALGDYIDAVVVDITSNADKALAVLELESARAALLPLDALTPPAPLKAPQDEDCLGVASRLVTTPAEFRPAVDLLLGQVLVVKDRRAARRVLGGQPGQVRAVTLKGEVFYSSGAILVDTESNASTLSRPRQRHEYQEKIVRDEAQIDQFAQQSKDLEQQELHLRNEMNKRREHLKTASHNLEAARLRAQDLALAREQARNQLEWQRSRQKALQQELAHAAEQIKSLKDEEDKIADGLEQGAQDVRARSAELSALTSDEQQSQLAHWEAQAGVSAGVLENARQIETERRQEAEKFEGQLNETRVNIAVLQKDMLQLRGQAEEMRESEGGIGGEIRQLQELIEPAEEELKTAEARQITLEESEAASRNALNVAERHHAQAQIALARKQESLDSLRQRIEDDFGLVEFEYEEKVSGPTPLPFGDLVERLPIVQEIAPELEENLKRQRMQLRRMGAINPEAQKEFMQVSERHRFMISQIADLEKAEIDLKEVLAELDALMEREFRKTFDEVAAQFREIFARLFPGGSARLILTEAEGPNEEGIDIEARLPGKRMQRLALLSGGERSLTAAALVFALIKASPTPFCVMDEVDAALDEANIGRLRELLEELSEQTQFVIITHNRNTVQAADIIYGITMGRDTTSQSISLRLEQVDASYTE